MVVGPRHHPLGCQSTHPAADPVPGAQPSAGRIPVLGALCVQRAAADCRPAVDDLFAAVSRTGPDRCHSQPLGGRRHLDRRGVPGWLSAAGVVCRLGVALGWRVDRGARLRLWRLHGLAYSAYQRGSQPRLPADGNGLPRSCIATPFDLLRAGIGSHHRGNRFGARSGCAVEYLLSGCPGGVARGERGAAQDRGAGGSCSLVRCGYCRLGHYRCARRLDLPAGVGVQPSLHRLSRRRARLIASCPAVDPADARRLRCIRPHGGLLGPAELCLAWHRFVHRPEHGCPLYRRTSARAAGASCPARAALGA